MNILITGVLGHIGSYLLRDFLNKKNIKKIYLIDSAKSNNLNTLFNLPKNKKKIFFFLHDLVDKRIFNQLKNIDIIVHLASITNAEESVRIKKEIYRNNFCIFKNVLNFAIKKNIKLIHISSTSIYGSQVGIVNENEKDLRPQSPYAEVKLLEEKLLIKNSKKLKYVTLRFGTIFGTSFGMKFHTAVNKFCFNVFLKKPLPVWSRALDQYRPYLSIKDAIKSINFIIQRNIFDNQIYNVLTNNFTVQDILNSIKKNKIKFKVKKTFSKIMNQYSYRVSKTKFENLGITLDSDLNIDIRDTLELFTNINKYK
jgi:nucleoside-diphosphate-sugar epimerase